MLGRRLLSAAVLITFMVLLLWSDFWLGKPDSLGRSGVLLALLSIVVATAAADEFARMWRGTNCHSSWLMMIGAATMVGLSNVPLLWRVYPTDFPVGKFGWVLAGIAAAVFIVFVYEMFAFRPDAESKIESNAESIRAAVATRIAKSTFAFVYIAMLLGFVLPHRQIQDNNHLGITAVVLLIATVKLSDSFAYFTGKSIGSRRIAPRLSPNKTLEGAIGGLVGGIVGALIVVYWASPHIINVDVPKPFWWVIVYGLGVTIAGMVGDLAESLLKRDAQCKDSSSWLPGLGGVLDVIDSIVFAAPISFVIWLIAS